jgi:hypothetical protein
VIDHIEWLARVPEPKDVSSVDAVEVMDFSFCATKYFVNKVPACVLCAKPLLVGVMVVRVGLVGKYSDWPAVVYLCHTDCTLNNMDLVLLVQKPRGRRVRE